MTPDLAFLVVTASVVPAWLLLAVAPASRWTQRLIHAIWIPMLFALAYLWALSHVVFSVWQLLTLEGVMTLFQDRYGVLCAWIHILAFDLFAGAWEARDARRHEIAHVFLLPCLGLTFMLAPLGFLAYLTLRWLRTGDRALEEAR